MDLWELAYGSGHGIHSSEIASSPLAPMGPGTWKAGAAGLGAGAVPSQHPHHQQQQQSWTDDAASAFPLMHNNLPYSYAAPVASTPMYALAGRITYFSPPSNAKAGPFMRVPEGEWAMAVQSGAPPLRVRKAGKRRIFSHGHNAHAKASADASARSKHLEPQQRQQSRSRNPPPPPPAASRHRSRSRSRSRSPHRRRSTAELSAANAHAVPSASESESGSYDSGSSRNYSSHADADGRTRKRNAPDDAAATTANGDVAEADRAAPSGESSHSNTRASHSNRSRSTSSSASDRRSDHRSPPKRSSPKSPARRRKKSHELCAGEYEFDAHAMESQGYEDSREDREQMNGQANQSSGHVKRAVNFGDEDGYRADAYDNTCWSGSELHSKELVRFRVRGAGCKTGANDRNDALESLCRLASSEFANIAEDVNRTCESKDMLRRRISRVQQISARLSREASALIDS